jgi:hypothetical protein
MVTDFLRKFLLLDLVGFDIFIQILGDASPKTSGSFDPEGHLCT